MQPSMVSSADKGTGPRNLHEMLDIPSDLDQYKHIIGNYPLNLLEVCRIEDLEQMEDNLEENIPENRILEKLVRRFQLTEQEAEKYIEKYGRNN